MTADAKRLMTADEFIAWAIEQPDGQHYELVAGEIVPMAPERVSHTRIKAFVWLRIREALRVHAACEVFGSGPCVRIGEMTVYEPDAFVRCGERLDGDAVDVIDPVIVVEVVSPSSRARDTGAKLEDYFRLPSLRHYLILKSETRSVIHHARSGTGLIETRILRSGPLHLDPPGITLKIESLFED